MQFDDIFILPVSDYFIIHSPLRRISALSNSMAVQYLYDILISGESPKSKLAEAGSKTKDERKPSKKAQIKHIVNNLA